MSSKRDSVPVPRSIPKDVILRAMERIDRSGISPHGPSQTFDVVHDGKGYPPPAVVAFAIEALSGQLVPPGAIRGGLKTPAFKVLEAAGFKIEPKGSTSVFTAQKAPTKEMEQNHVLGMICGYYLSRFDHRAYASLGYGTQTATHEALGDALGVKMTSIKNWRDEFDPVHENGRQGWRNRPMHASRRRTIKVLGGLTESKLLNLVREITASPASSSANKVIQDIADTEAAGPETLEPTDDRGALEKRARALIGTVNLDKIPKGNPNPKRGEQKVATGGYIRDPEVVAWVRKKAAGVCEHCHAQAPFNSESTSEPYLEVHHVTPLSEGGPDKIENCVALCPNCHRRCHYGQDRHDVVAKLLLTVDRLIPIESSG